MLNKYNCIFVQIPRTGSSSINSILNQTGGYRPASYYMYKYKKEWPLRLKFAVVRNPFDRYRSILAHFHGEIPDIVLKPQSWYIDEPLNLILRFESLPSEWWKVAEFLNIKEPLPHLNKSNKTPLSQEQRDWVLENWSEDFKRFGYQRNSP